MASLDVGVPSRSAARVRLLRRFRRWPLSMRVGALILACYVVVAATGWLWAPYPPSDTVARPFSGAGLEHLLGTDLLGRDVFSRVVHGARDVLVLAFSGTAVALVIGAAVGLLSGYVRGWVDVVLMRFFEVLISIPILLLVLLVIAAAGVERSGNPLLLIGVLVLVYVPRVARLARSVAVDLVTRDFVTVARSRGESASSIARRELLPNATGVLLVEFGVRAGSAPILISALGFLGFGARPPSPEWGLMISENRSAIVTAPVAVLAPAVALMGLVIALNLFTDGLARLLGRSVTRTP